MIGRALSVAAVVALGAPQAAVAAPSTGEMHGAQLARACAGCHAVGTSDQSRNGGAPPFRTLGMRYNRLQLEAALKRVARAGHHQMPPHLSDTDAEDLAAYVASLEPGR